MLRERTRAVIREDITRVAIRLFLDSGYEATTTGDIADAVGMSQRSIFRYFPTKKDIVVGKFGRGADDMLSALHARPLDEPAWRSLRCMFEAVDSPGDPDSHRVQRMIFNTPDLLSVYLRTLHEAEIRASKLLVERAVATSTPYAPDDPAPRALSAAAFGCLVTAQEMFLSSAGRGRSLAPHIDRAMNAVISLSSAATPPDGALPSARPDP